MTTLGYFDCIREGNLYGWAFDDSDPGRPLSVEAITTDGRVLGTAKADMFRGDLLTAGCGTDGRCAFKITLDANLADLIGTEVYVRETGATVCLAGSPRTITLNRNIQALLTRSARVEPISGACARGLIEKPPAPFQLSCLSSTPRRHG